MMKQIIDSHAHITKSGFWINSNKKSSLEILKEELKNNNVEKAILIAIEGIVSNEFIEENMIKHAELFWSFCSVNPLKVNFTTFMNYFKRKKFVGIKIHPRLHKFSLKNKKVKQFFSELDSKIKTIILIDCWFSENDPVCLIEEFKTFVKSINNIDIILAHSGGFKYKDIIELAKKKNVYLDLSYTLNTFKKHNKNDLINDFMIKLKTIDSSKIIFGSDFPEYSITETVKLIENLLTNYGFSKKNKNKIFGGNIKTIIEKNE